MGFVCPVARQPNKLTLGCSEKKESIYFKGTAGKENRQLMVKDLNSPVVCLYSGSFKGKSRGKEKKYE